MFFTFLVNLVDDTRKNVAKLLKCRDDEIYFTGSGTESNNTAIVGAVKSRKKLFDDIVIVYQRARTKRAYRL